MELAWNVTFQESSKLAAMISAGITVIHLKIAERANFLQNICSVMEKYAQKTSTSFCSLKKSPPLPPPSITFSTYFTLLFITHQENLPILPFVLNLRVPSLFYDYKTFIITRGYPLTAYVSRGKASAYKRVQGKKGRRCHVFLSFQSM